MILPDYWLPHPAMSLDVETLSSFDQLLAQVKSAGTNTLIRYTLSAPKWQFLCHAAEHHAIAMHGTGNPDIQLFEPRQSNDLAEFGNQTAVYAAGDGLWAMFFAIIDRDRHPMSISNACIRVADTTGFVSEPRYVFSVSQKVLPLHPWRTGFVYLLPSESFVTQPVMPFGPYEIRIPQLASPVEVTPIARLEIAPEDFPFLNDIRSHDDARFAEYSHALQTGGPWPDESDERT